MINSIKIAIIFIDCFSSDILCSIHFISLGHKSTPLKHFSKLKSMVIDVGSEIVADDGLNLDDMLNEDDNDNNKDKQKSENKVEILKKSMKHEIIEEEEDDDEEDYSDKEEEFNDDNLFVRSEKYKERNNHNIGLLNSSINIYTI